MPDKIRVDKHLGNADTGYHVPLEENCFFTLDPFIVMFCEYANISNSQS